ncbi:MAG: hypothetical protein M0P93_09430 [Candidatus Cloacimonetes bacterium]|nr:hypothetical protein [Candidatus Cloacimonadota bacterium]
MKIALVSCAKLKQDYPCQAQEMYLPSTLFSKAIKYIKQQNYDKWFILSAKYGLLNPNVLIEPYDLTLNNMKSEEIKKWSQKVFNQLIEYNIIEIDFYAGEKYRKYLIPLLENKSIKYNIPLKGLGIGKQLQFYTKELVG